MHMVWQKKEPSTNTTQRLPIRKSTQVTTIGSHRQIWIKKVQPTVIYDMINKEEAPYEKLRVSLQMKNRIRDLQVLLFGMASIKTTLHILGIQPSDILCT